MAAILVIDAYDGFRATMEYCLPKFGHAVCCVPDAAAALRAVEGGGVDLVLLDIGLPRCTGLADCEQLRRSAGFANTPIVMLAGFLDAEITRRARAAGAVEVVAKPFQWPALLAVIARWGGGPRP